MMLHAPAHPWGSSALGSQHPTSQTSSPAGLPVLGGPEGAALPRGALLAARVQRAQEPLDGAHAASRRCSGGHLQRRRPGVDRAALRCRPVDGRCRARNLARRSESRLRPIPRGCRRLRRQPRTRGVGLRDARVPRRTRGRCADRRGGRADPGGERRGSDPPGRARPVAARGRHAARRQRPRPAVPGPGDLWQPGRAPGAGRGRAARDRAGSGLPSDLVKAAFGDTSDPGGRATTSHPSRPPSSVGRRSWANSTCCSTTCVSSPSRAWAGSASPGSRWRWRAASSTAGSWTRPSSYPWEAYPTPPRCRLASRPRWACPSTRAGAYPATSRDTSARTTCCSSSTSSSTSPRERASCSTSRRSARASSSWSHHAFLWGCRRSTSTRSMGSSFPRPPPRWSTRSHRTRSGCSSPARGASTRDSS
jgi:hypothetical protein